MIAAALLLLAGPPAAAAPRAEEAARLVAACGLPARSVAVRDDPLLEEEVVAVRTTTPPPSEAQLSCVARASLATSVEIQFEAARTRARFDRAFYSMAGAKGLADARAWLAERGLLARLPVWDGTLAGLAEAGIGIERLCGLEPGSTLVVRYRALTFPAKGLDPERVNPEDLFCLLHAARAAGVTLGFIGNEAYRPAHRGRAPRRSGRRPG